MLSVDTMESAATFEQFPGFLYNLTSFNATYSGEFWLRVQCMNVLLSLIETIKE